MDDLHRTVEGLFEEEEALLNLHMNIIQVHLTLALACMSIIQAILHISITPA